MPDHLAPPPPDAAATTTTFDEWFAPIRDAMAAFRPADTATDRMVLKKTAELLEQGCREAWQKGGEEGSARAEAAEAALEHSRRVLLWIMQNSTDVAIVDYASVTFDVTAPAPRGGETTKGR